MALLLVLMVLWPNLKDKAYYPVYCSTVPFNANKISTPLQQSFNNVYTDITPNLVNNEWSKHGTCSTKTQQDYFETVVQLNTQLPIQHFIKKYIGKSVSYQDFKNALGGDIEHSALVCKVYDFDDKQYIAQIYRFFDKNLNSINLPLKIKDENCVADKPIYIRKPFKFISISKYKKSFEGKSPMNVGFDIDDTVLFSSGPFYYAQNTYKHAGKNLPPKFWQ